MTESEIKAWIADERRAYTLPFGVYEPAYQKVITGAALVVRGVVSVTAMRLSESVPSNGFDAGSPG
ncbi:hypothetical protein ACS0X5_21945 [Burkholderia gladioli]|uniref:hypothetical protein n=1 Tax=Burkholderia gladioli TaxID=28095 RepID=UPI00163E0339|nr:hypothetical protein [Burkholderia gladioli]